MSFSIFLPVPSVKQTVFWPRSTMCEGRENGSFGSGEKKTVLEYSSVAMATMVTMGSTITIAFIPWPTSRKTG